jgi:hypothetical protein
MGGKLDVLRPMNTLQLKVDFKASGNFVNYLSNEAGGRIAVL